MLRIGNREIHADLPYGFWQQDRDIRHAQITKKWPTAIWAGNGRGGDAAINHYFD